MAFPANKTKLVCTIGPASDSPRMLEKMISAGMNVARLNFSHGDFASHRDTIEKIRQASRATGRQVAIMADLPGPKMRIGRLAEEPVELEADSPFTLTTEKITGDVRRVSVSFPRLPRAVAPGNTLYLNDGYIQLEVEAVTDTDVHCKVIVGGNLRSRKGLNLPGIDLGISAFTDHDRDCLKFALENGVDAVSQSFVETGADIDAVREAAAEALALSSSGQVAVAPMISYIDPDVCIGCQICIGLCPYAAIEFNELKGISEVNEAVCKGCGSCAAYCPSGAAKVRHFTDKQIYAEIDGLLAG